MRPLRVLGILFGLAILHGNIGAETVICDFSKTKKPQVSSTGADVFQPSPRVNLNDLENFDDLKVGQKFDFPISESTTVKLELKARGRFEDGRDYSLVQDKNTGEYLYLINQPDAAGTIDFQLYTRGPNGSLGNGFRTTRIASGLPAQIRTLEANRELLVKPSTQLTSVEREARQRVRQSRTDDYRQIRERGTMGSTNSPTPGQKIADNLPSNFNELSGVADKIFSPEGEKLIFERVKKMRFVKSSMGDGTSGDARQIFEFKLNDNTFVSYAVSSSDGVVTSREVLIGVKEADGKFRFAGFGEEVGRLEKEGGSDVFLSATTNGSDRAIARPLRHGGDSRCMNCHAFNGNGFFNTNSGGQRVQRFFNGEPDGVPPGGSFSSRNGQPSVIREKPRGAEIEIVDPEQVLSTF